MPTRKAKGGNAIATVTATTHGPHIPGALAMRIGRVCVTPVVDRPGHQTATVTVVATPDQPDSDHSGWHMANWHDSDGALAASMPAQTS